MGSTRVFLSKIFHHPILSVLKDFAAFRGFVQDLSQKHFSQSSIPPPFSNKDLFRISPVGTNTYANLVP